MERGKQMMALGGWYTSQPLPANPPFQSRQAQLESGVRGNVPAPFGAGERLQSPTYRYRSEVFTHILVPLDGSEYSERAVEPACGAGLDTYACACAHAHPARRQHRS